MRPDPEQVAKALANIDAKERALDSIMPLNGERVTDDSIRAYRSLREAWAMNAWILAEASKAWIAQQAEEKRLRELCGRSIEFVRFGLDHPAMDDPSGYDVLRELEAAAKGVQCKT